MTLPASLIAVLCIVLVTAAIHDLSSFTIPNVLPAAMLVLFCLFVIVMALGGRPFDGPQLSQHLIAGGLGLFLGMVLFALGWVGGGDAKLFAATCLWLGWGSMLDYAVAASLAGGVLTLFIIFCRKTPFPVFIASRPRIMRVLSGEAGIPYGVALAAAALFILPHTDVYGMLGAQ